jgi:hypothetical protein
MTLTKHKHVSPSVAHRKRTGQHHRHSGHYIKTYWPYLPVFAVLLLGVLLNGVIGRWHHNVLGYSTNISAQVLLAETNGEAAGENLAYGFGSSDQVMTAWMHSPEHRANIMNSVYQDVGFATANVANYQGTGPETIVVAEYGEPVGMINESTGTTASTPVVLGTHTLAVSRASLLSTASWVPMLLAALAGGALTLFFARHAFAWHKVLARGEQFFLAHPFFDVFLMSLAVLAFLLSHAAGTIL